MDGGYLTIIGRYDDSGDTTVALVPWKEGAGDPHLAALRHTGQLSEDGEFSVVAVLLGRCQVLVTQQSLQLYTEKLLSQ